MGNRFPTPSGLSWRRIASLSSLFHLSMRTFLGVLISAERKDHCEEAADKA